MTTNTGQILIAGTTVPSHVLSGDTFSAGTNYETLGTMVNNGGMVINPTSSAITIPAGYHNGSGKVNAVTFDQTKVLTGTTIAGTAGTMASFSGQTLSAVVTSVSGTTLTFNSPSSGFVDTTSKFSKSEPNLVAGNILSGVSIFGVAGSAQPKQYASGTVTTGTVTKTFTNTANTQMAMYPVTVTGLTFQPKVIIITKTGSTSANFEKCIYDSYYSAISNAPIVDSYNFGGSPSVNNMQLDGTSAYVNSTGFQIPVEFSSCTFSWIAYG